MNRGAINRVAINAKVSDLVVRVAIDAKAYARIRASGRVFTNDAIHCTPTALHRGSLGMVEAPFVVACRGIASIGGTLGHVNVRAPVRAMCRARISIVPPPISQRIYSSPRARLSLVAGLEARTKVSTRVRAAGTVVQRVLKGAAIHSAPRVKTDLKVTVLALRLVRMPVEMRAKAQSAISGHVEALLTVQSAPKVQTDLQVRALVRAPVHSIGEVRAVIDTSVYKELPFDEPAPEHRTFRVPAGVHTFYVVN